MAVFGGSRVRSGLGHASAGRHASAIPDRRRRPLFGGSVASAAAPALARSARKVRPAGLLMAAIMAATMLGLVYLTQTLGANATNSAIHELETELRELETVIWRQEADVLKSTEADEVIRRLKPLKLVRLNDPEVLRAP